jgi:hypothetical protein
MQSGAKSFIIALLKRPDELQYFFAANNSHQYDDDGDNQKKMNETAHGVGSNQTHKPQQ